MNKNYKTQNKEAKLYDEKNKGIGLYAIKKQL